MKSLFLFDEDDFASVAPQWWSNFVENSDYFLDVNNVNDALAEHNAKFAIRGTHRFIHFETEDDFVMFMLRFS